MGDRANVAVKGDDGTVYLYTHWAGEKLRDTVAAGLKRGRGRWSDPYYLRRILFSEMTQNSVLDENGYGIGADIGDNQIGRPILVIDTQTQTIGLAKQQSPTEVYMVLRLQDFIEEPGALPWE